MAVAVVGAAVGAAVAAIVAVVTTVNEALTSCWLEYLPLVATTATVCAPGVETGTVKDVARVLSWSMRTEGMEFVLPSQVS